MCSYHNTCCRDQITAALGDGHEYVHIVPREQARQMDGTSCGFVYMLASTSKILKISMLGAREVAAAATVALEAARLHEVAEAAAERARRQEAAEERSQRAIEETIKAQEDLKSRVRR